MRLDGRRVYDRDPEERLARAIDAWRARGEQADLVVLSGDQSDDAQASSMERVREMVLPLGAQLLAVPGNHDDRDAHREVYGETVPLELGGWRVIGLDSSIPGEIHGALDATRVAQQLDGLDAIPTVLVLHHPPVPPTPNPWFRLDGAAALLSELAARPHVRAVLSGHAHSPFAIPRRSLLLLGAPSTLVAFRFSREGAQPAADIPAGARALRLGERGTLSHELLIA